MKDLRFLPMSLDFARHIQTGGTDANDQVAELMISDGNGNQCRHCLEMIEKGTEMLVFSYRPFSVKQPYAETGPVFVHKSHCSSFIDYEVLPETLKVSDEYLLKGYDSQERIVYGTGKVVKQSEMIDYAECLLADDRISFVHVRSASNNCYQARIESQS